MAARFVPGDIVVKWRSQTSPNGSAGPRVATLASANAPRLSYLATFPVVSQRTLFAQTQLVRLQTRTRAATLAAVAALSKRSDVVYAQPNFLRQTFGKPNDDMWPLQWNLQRVKMEQAWDLTNGSTGVIVAVVDTGIKVGHPDLAGRLLPGYDFIKDTGRAGDGDGWDANPDDNGNNTAASSAFHGTHVAGIIGANGNNKTGIAGVDWRCRIVPVRALGIDGGKGSDADIAAAIRWSAGLSVPGAPPNQNPAHIINLSFGGPGEGKVLTDAIKAAIAHGAIVVAAAGNQNQDVSNVFPAATPGVITVGAIDFNNKRAGYSNYGGAVDIMAPGGMMSQNLPVTHQNKNDWPAGVVSTMFYTPGQAQTWGYHMLEGTSQAAPLVAGVVALMLARNPNLTSAQVVGVLKGTADSNATCNEGCGAGLMRADAAVKHATNPQGNGGGGGQPSGGAYGSSCSIDAQCAERTCRQVVGGGRICTRFCSQPQNCPSGSNCRGGLCTPAGSSSNNNNNGAGVGNKTTVYGTSGCSLSSRGESRDSADGMLLGLVLALLPLLALIAQRRRRRRRPRR